MTDLNNHILETINERGNILAYTILSNLAIDLLKEGKDVEDIKKYITHLTTPLELRKV